MNLILTAYKDFWTSKESNILLGKWCAPLDDSNSKRKLEEIMAYHWDNRKNIINDFIYLTKVYEKCLVQVSETLNFVHHKNFSKRYWEIIVGPWLRLFLEVMFDRYMSLKTANLKYNNLKTILVDLSDKSNFIMMDFAEFQNNISKDLYNIYLYSLVIDHFNWMSFQTKKINFECESERYYKYDEGYLLLGVEKSKNRKFRKKEIVLSVTLFKKKHIFKLSSVLPAIPLKKNRSATRMKKIIDLELREKTCIEDSTDEFTMFFSKIVFQNIPFLYLEGYVNFFNIISKHYSTVPKLIMTANNHYANEGFKFRSALATENKSKLIILQHGGNTGTCLFSSADDHEIAISDYFISWGWRDSSFPKIKPLPAQKLIDFPKKEVSEKIIWVLNDCPKYSYRLFSFPFGPFWKYYIEFQIELIEKIPLNILKQIIFKPYHKDYGWSMQQQMTKKNPHIKFCNSNENWEKLLSESKLIVETTNTTTFLETLASNTPVLLILQPEYWELNKNALEKFNLLKNAGIYHTNAESFISKLLEIYNNPLKWWMQPEVQKARNLFCFSYARKSSKWADEWKDFIKEVVND